MAIERDRRGGAFALTTGIIIGVLWIAMALASLWSAIEGLRNDRPDWGLGWGLVGILLLAAGAAAIVGSWWHEFKVKTHD